MKRQKFNKQLVNALRFTYRFGLIKALLLFVTIFAAAEEYKVKWKGRQVHMRKGTTDFCVFRQVLVFEQYKVKGLEKEKVKVVVDLGANVGLSTLYFKSIYPNATIIAVEPDKDNFELMTRNVGACPNVYCLNNAIWNTSKTLGVYDSGGGEYSYLVKEESESEIGSVRSVTINDIMERFELQKIDLLKIDIEGSEKELFSGHYASWLHKVDCIVIEVHDWFRPGCAAAFFRAISMRDYTFSFKGENITIVFDKTPQPVTVALEGETDQSSFISIGRNVNLSAGV